MKTVISNVNRDGCRKGATYRVCKRMKHGAVLVEIHANFVMVLHRGEYSAELL